MRRCDCGGGISHMVSGWHLVCWLRFSVLMIVRIWDLVMTLDLEHGVVTLFSSPIRSWICTCRAKPFPTPGPSSCLALVPLVQSHLPHRSIAAKLALDLRLCRRIRRPAFVLTWTAAICSAAMIAVRSDESRAELAGLRIEN
jgi:hypothetical protein